MRAVRRDDHVAGHGKFTRARQAPAVDCGNGRFGASPDGHRQVDVAGQCVMPVFCAGNAFLDTFGNIVADRESLAGATQYDDPHLVVGFQFSDFFS